MKKKVFLLVLILAIVAGVSIIAGEIVRMERSDPSGDNPMTGLLSPQGFLIVVTLIVAAAWCVIGLVKKIIEE